VNLFTPAAFPKVQLLGKAPHSNLISKKFPSPGVLKEKYITIFIINVQKMLDFFSKTWYF
jgi:hypothetical protein